MKLLLELLLKVTVHLEMQKIIKFYLRNKTCFPCLHSMVKNKVIFDRKRLSYKANYKADFNYFKVALTLLRIYFLNFAESFILACWSILCNYKWGSPCSFLRYEQLKLKYGVFLQVFSVAMLPCCHILLNKND